jgi:hypothetical protein
LPDRVIYLEDETQLAGDNIADDTAALKVALNSASPGDVVKAKRGAEYRLASVAPYPDVGIPMPEGCTSTPTGPALTSSLPPPACTASG